MQDESQDEETPVTRHRQGEVDEDVETILYWLSRPPAERISAMEELREMWYGKDYETKYRLSRTDQDIQRYKR